MATTVAKVRFVVGALIREPSRCPIKVEQVTTALDIFYRQAWQRRSGVSEPIHTFVQVESSRVAEYTAGSLEIDFLREDHLINAAWWHVERGGVHICEPTLMCAIGRLPFCVAWLACSVPVSGEPDWHQRLMDALVRMTPECMIWYDSATDEIRQR